MKPVFLQRGLSLVLRQSRREAGGFALVISLSLMVLMTVLVVSLLSLSVVSLRSSAASEDMTTARANARMALALAIGELQKTVGPDQAVTASASVLGEKISQPHWTGVWRNGGGAADEPRWLVSHRNDGEFPDPTKDGTDDLTPLVSKTPNDAGVKVPAVTVGNGASARERFAWWVADEAAKVRVDIEKHESDTLSRHERLARSLSAQRTGLGHAEDDWKGLEKDVAEGKLVSVSTASLAAGDKELAERYLHDFTTGGFGLPVNVREGGMKVDLSTVFDTSDRSHAQTMAKYCGAAPEKAAMGGAQIYRFSTPTGKEAAGKFFLAADLTAGGSKGVGPNWGNLYNYAQLYQNMSGSKAQLIGAWPDLYTDIRASNWAPYSQHQFMEFNDKQHVTSGIRPVISTLQMGFRLKAKPAPAPPGAVAGQSYYQIQVEVKPLIGLWNPYNVSIPATSYRLDWAVYPYMRLGISKGEFQPRPRVWLRESWLSNGSYPESLQNRWFNLQTDDVDFQPGEFRLFSIAKKADMAQVNKLTPAWSRDGAFTLDLKWNSFGGSPDGKAGQPMVVESGTEVWIGDLFVEDTQHSETKDHFGTVSDTNSASWATLKTGDGQVLSRYSDVWTSGRSTAGWSVPEQLASLWAQTGVTAPRYTVEHLTATQEHMGTWAMNIRTTTEAAKKEVRSGAPTQTLRGWVDSNPRALAANPLWDGSKAGANGFEGWWFCSHMMGGTHPGVHSDKGPGGRGMVAWGSAIGNEAPQIKLPAGRRFQGYGGATSGPSGGQTQVAIYDVPRCPLVSVGSFQHAELSRYNFEPAYVLGNSYANVRIPLRRTAVENFNGVRGFKLVDLSHAVNERIWDSFFFSTLAPAYKGSSGTLDAAFPLDAVAYGATPLPNPRMMVLPRADDVSFSAIKSESDGHPAEAIAARIGILGAFNVNSTSKVAWKAMLASLAGSEFPVVSSDRLGLTWSSSDKVRFSRFGPVINPTGYGSNDSGKNPEFWQSFRALNDDELDRLAEEIVREVRERGPFRSMADFVNRDPESSNVDHQRKGALQSALDRVVNQKLRGDVGQPVEVPAGALASNKVIDAASPENQAAGHAGYLMQGDVLQALAPVIQARSDYFRVRAMGEVLSEDGKRVVARAVCEAFVQREADYIDAADAPEISPADLESEVNRRFGRSLRLVSFRWLAADEI